MQSKNDRTQRINSVIMGQTVKDRNIERDILFFKLSGKAYEFCRQRSVC